MEIKYLNHSSFTLKTSVNGKNITILFDPFDDSIGVKFKQTDADIVLLSHLHPDHSNLSKVTGLSEADVKNENFKAFDNRPFLVKRPGEFEAKGIHIKGISSFHDDKEGKERGTNTIYTVINEGLKVCHLGDLGHILTDDQIEEIGDCDVLFVPVGGEYTIGAERACEVISQIEPSFVIPMHFKTDKHNEGFENVATLDVFLKEFGKESDTEFKDKFVVTKTSAEETQLVLLKPLY